MKDIKDIRGKKGFICDMDGVIYHGNNLIDGVLPFVTWLMEQEKHFVFLTTAGAESEAEKNGIGRSGGAFLHQRPGNGKLSEESMPRWQRICNR